MRISGYLLLNETLLIEDQHPLFEVIMPDRGACEGFVLEMFISLTAASPSVLITYLLLNLRH